MNKFGWFINGLALGYLMIVNLIDKSIQTFALSLGGWIIYFIFTLIILEDNQPKKRRKK